MWWRGTIAMAGGQPTNIFCDERVIRMSNQEEKRMVSDTGYEVQQAMRIGGKEILLAENRSAEDGQWYLVSNYKEQGIFAEYSKAIITDDYLEAVEEFAQRIKEEAAAICAEQTVRNLPAVLYTAEHCLPHSFNECIEGQVVAVKAEVFSPEYRRGEYQLVWVTGGNGAKENARGSAVFCHHLNTGEHTRFERQDVLGAVRAEHLPSWAKESLIRLQEEKDKPPQAKEFAGRYEITERMEVGQKVFALGHNKAAAQPYGTWQGRKGVKDSFDLGHYFSTYETAKTDLQDRAAKEQKHTERQKRNDKER